MANKTKELSDTQIRLAKARDKEYSLADGKGLYLRIKPIGSKTWLFNYTRPITKKRANLGLGNYPDLTLADARIKAKELRHALAKGIDPQEYRRSIDKKDNEAYANTLQKVTNKWLSLKKEKVSTSYYQKIVDRLDKYILPKLGNIPIHQIKPVDAIQVISPIADAGKLETVKKLCRWLNEIMIYALNTGLIDIMPYQPSVKPLARPK